MTLATARALQGVGRAAVDTGGSEGYKELEGMGGELLDMGARGGRSWRRAADMVKGNQHDEGKPRRAGRVMAGVDVNGDKGTTIWSHALSHEA